MTKKSVAVSVGLVGIISGNLDYAVASEEFGEIKPVMTISEEVTARPKLPREVRKVLEENNISFDLSAGYNVPEGFSFDPFSRVLESDFTENGKFGYKIGEGYGERGNDFWYQLRKDSPAHYVLSYFDDFSMGKGDFLREGKKVLAGGDIMDFDLSGMSLEEIKGMFKRFDEFSETSGGDGFFKSVVDLPASSEIKGCFISERDIGYSDGSKLNVVSGAFGSVELGARVYSGADINWGEKNFADDADVAGIFFYRWTVQNGFLVQGKVTSPNEVSLGAGAIRKEGAGESSLERSFLEVDASVPDSDVGLEIIEEGIREDFEWQEDVLYLTAGIDKGKYWGSSSLGIKMSRREGDIETKKKMQEFYLGLKGLKEKSLDSVVSEKDRESSNELIYNFVGGRDLFNGGIFDVSVHGYIGNYPDSEFYLGGSFRSDLLNLFVSGKDYFVAGKLTGERGSFKKGFRDSVEEKGSFLREYLPKSNLWKGKKEFYVFTERDDNVESVGGTICFDEIYTSAALVGDGELKGGRLGIGGNWGEVEGEYLKGGSGERVGLAARVGIGKDWYFIGSGSSKGDDKNFSFKVVRPFNL